EWHGRRFAAVLFSMAVVALPGASVALCCPQYSAVPSDTPGIYLTVCNEKWVYAGINVAQLVYSTTTTTACLVLEVRTLMEYRKYNAVARRLHHHEYRLLPIKDVNYELKDGNYGDYGTEHGTMEGYPPSLCLRLLKVSSYPRT
ncbi:hypothetical protein AAVH_26356, partial [Aphelenchoides avenae]